MTGRRAGWRLTLVAVLLVGLVGFAGPFTSGATFTDAHNATGAATAVDSFNGGGGGGGPTAEAGGPYSIAEGSSTTLDGTGSQVNNNPSYSWQIVSGPGTLTDATTATPTYEAPADVSQDTTVTVELTVTDNKGSDTDTATVTVENTSSSGDTTAPTISNFQATDSGTGGVTVSFDSDEALNTIRVDVNRKSHGTEVVLTENDFQSSQSGATYTYTATASVAKNPKQYSATLTDATDDAGNDGASGQTDGV